MKQSEYIRKSALTDTNYTRMGQRLGSELYLQRLTHGALGLAGEAGEVVDMVKKAVMFNKPVDETKLTEEMGDVIYYMAVICRAVGTDFEKIMAQNIKKLEARFPNGFSEAAALARKDMK